MSERIKLEGDEYQKSYARRNKEEQTTGAAMEVYRSLDSLPQGHLESIEEALNDAMESGSLLGYPIVSTKVRIVDGRWSNLRSKNVLIF